MSDVAMDVPESRGEPIAGSRFFRNWCSCCGEPIRVAESQRMIISITCTACGDDPEAAAHRLHRLQSLTA